MEEKSKPNTHIISIALANREAWEIAETLRALLDHSECENYMDLYVAIGERISDH